MSIIISKSDYDRYENQLKQYVKQILKNINIVILDATAIDVVKSLKIKYAFSSKYTLHRLPIPTPVTPQYTGIEWNITPDRLFYLEVEPLVREFQGYIAMDLYDKPICVLDTGINENHRIFRNNMNIIEKLSVVGDDGSDRDGHGTHVNGIIATLVPYSRIVSIKIFRDSECTTTELLAGLDLAVQKKCAVVNMSLGGYPSKEEIDMVEPVLKQLRDQGIVLVVASGNESQINQISYPASSDNVISVGAVTLLLMRAYYSNVDVTNQKPHFTAFGDNILSASNTDNESYALKSGTSMATPIVSAIAYYLYYFYDVAKEYGGNLPVAILNTVVDPRKPPFDAIFDALKQLALQNNPFGTWNTTVSWGIVSFRRLSWFDVWGFSFRAIKPPLLYPPASLPKLISMYPSFIERLIEKYLSEKNYQTIIQMIQQYPDILDAIMKNIDLLKNLIIQIPDLLNVIPPEKTQQISQVIDLSELTKIIQASTQGVTLGDLMKMFSNYEYKYCAEPIYREFTYSVDSMGSPIASVHIWANNPVTIDVNDGDIVYYNVTEVKDVIISGKKWWVFKVYSTTLNKVCFDIIFSGK